VRQLPAIARAVELAFQALRVDAIGGAGEQRRQCLLQARLVEGAKLLQPRGTTAIAWRCKGVEHTATTKGALGGLVAQDDAVAMYRVARCVEQ